MTETTTPPAASNDIATTHESARAPAEEQTPTITFDDFMKVELRVGQIVAAEKIEKSNKLMKLKVDLAEARGPRQIIAGIAKHYSGDELIGKKIVVVANLAPAKLMGELSEGMLLAASDDTGLALLHPGEISVGGQVR